MPRQCAKYVLETYVSRAQIPKLPEQKARLLIAARDMGSDGRNVLYLETLLMPDEEICFFVFEADSAEDVAEVGRRAGLGYERIVRAE